MGLTFSQKEKTTESKNIEVQQKTNLQSTGCVKCVVLFDALKSFVDSLILNRAVHTVLIILLDESEAFIFLNQPSSIFPSFRRINRSDQSDQYIWQQVHSYSANAC